MKGFVLSLIMVLAMALNAHAAYKLPNKYPTYAQAHAAAVKQDKRMFVLFTASWCAPCQEFKKQILYSDGLWQPLNRYFIVHMVDIDVEKSTVKMFSDAKVYTGSVPTMYFLDHGGKKIIGRHIGGFSNPNSFASWYKFVHQLK